ncbi:DNA-binding MarR family transcriptional regulator [Marmoricola sp. OAE513]|uniref:MarR family winged helix-turn-helix transcriptional regulator n=1 Tax=Marmoricola sp. OAE513 TaxID=2817894 RepID=UPI001AEB91E5
MSTDDSARLYLAMIRLNRALRRDSREAQVSHGGLSAIATLVAEGPQRAGTLAEIEGITAPATTRLVNALEALGYVARTPDPADGRAQLLVATEAGHDLVLAGRTARLQAIEERFERLAPEERAAIVAALTALEALTNTSIST